MAAEGCFYCQKDRRLQDIMIEIAELRVSTLYLNRDQLHPGRCIVAYNRHATEIFQLEPEQLRLFSEDVALAAKILSRLYRPDKINYGIYGDLVPHLHVHLVPKRNGAAEWGGTFENVRKSPAFLKDSEYEQILRDFRQLLAEIRGGK